MRILLTNDDGLQAPGLAVVEEIAAQVLDAVGGGELWVVAPETEKSGVGHCVSYIDPVRVTQYGDHRFAVAGYPADTVLIALHGLMAEAPPDLILSGVNRGHNVAEDLMYSGTVGAAMEGALQGIRSIGMSQFFGPENLALEDMFEAARAYGAEAVRRTLTMPWADDSRRKPFYNINFPPVAAADVLGFKAAPQGVRPKHTFAAEAAVGPNRREYYWITHKGGSKDSAPGDDSHECGSGWITVTPCRADLTAPDHLDATAAALAAPLAG